MQQKLSQALTKYISYLLVAKDKAIMVALHYFKAKKISSVPFKALKDNCKRFHTKRLQVKLICYGPWNKDLMKKILCK